MEHALVAAAAATRIPSGTVTFMFTDIEGSTRRWEQYPAAMQTAVREHDGIVRDIIAQHGGYVFKALGDAFCCAFASAQSAVRAAVACERALTAHDFSAVGGLPVRIALHTGTSEERDGDYFGPTLNRTARLLAIAHGGQIVVSQAAYELLAHADGGDIGFTDFGNHGLRDLDRPEHVYGVLAAGLPAQFPPLRSLSVLPNNLPPARTSFVGREREISELVTLVAAHRLVTITGTGGIGKTRSSLLVAAEQLEAHRDGVWFIGLAALGAHAPIAETVARTLSIVLPPQTDAAQALVNALRPQSVLLVFDNCEHVVDSAARLIAAILDAAPGVRVLVSSREPLRIAGEYTYRLPSLAVPAPAVAATLDAQRAREYGAIVLFEERARAVDANFAINDENAPIVADIVRRLDGIALAIELAAPRVRILDLRSLERRIDERFRLLTAGNRDALPRQQTLRALIDWSYDLLAPDERRIFATMGVFVDGFSFEAAAAVCAPFEPDEFVVLERLASLVDKSLIIADGVAETTRYRLLESTRAYALERLSAYEELSGVQRRHARWFADVADRHAESYWTTPMHRWMPEVERERDNIRSAASWALEAGEIEIAARIVGGLEGLWYHASLSGEGARRCLAIIERLVPDLAGSTVARLWLTYARLSNARGMVDAAREAIARYDGAPSVQSAYAHQMLAVGLRRTGAYGDSLDAIDRALALYEQARTTDAWPYIKALDVRAGILRYAGRIAEARALRVDALERVERLGDTSAAVNLRMNLSDLEIVDGDPHLALALVRDAVEASRATGDAANRMVALVNTAACYVILNDADAAERAAREGLRLALRSGWDHGVAIAVQHLGTVAAMRGKADRAEALLSYADAWLAREGFAREPTERACYNIARAIVPGRPAVIPPESLLTLDALQQLIRGEQ